MSGICSAHKEFVVGCPQCEAGIEREIEWLDRITLTVKGLMIDIHMRSEMLKQIREEKL